MRLKDLENRILESPGWKTVFAFVLPILAGVLSGVFVSEITQNSIIVWSLYYKANSFYGLLILGLCTYLYNRALYLHEREVSRFMDTDYCVAYVRSKCLPEAAERYKELIRSGDGGQLKQAMDELKKVLK
ncbi:hypothetical protein [Pseudomonas fluorescens]|jgi:hypothetical protein|uniref:Transmembrane protein n=1 Tax=Pseudomonas fluorescens TaxID=294 RepID=A0A5E7N766_PSEFL|nr:hypothetical protein [Pseudomonas fluorescens]VVP33028.1 hypothetical protein PS880_04439 [Pseudomonas fluorescens]